MIEAISSISIVQTDLKRIMDKINEEMLKRIPSGTDNPVLECCITCWEGTQVSPCYVEKLYMEYSQRHGSPTVRRHLHIPLKDMMPSEGKLFVWEQTALPVSYMSGIKDLTIEKLWSAFPFHVSGVIEEGFGEDPFNRSLKLVIGGSQYVFNFETGEMYCAYKNKMYRFRCTVSAIDDRISCKMLNDSLYKFAAKHYRGAGVLFYSAHPITAEPVFLLGHMTYACESWCDFGGLKSFRY